MRERIRQRVKAHTNGHPPGPESSSRLAAALAYARRGWPVLPLHGIVERHCSCGKTDCGSPGKHPKITDWPNQATTDPSQIRAWWTQWPNANLGIATGAGSGLVVLDVDPRHGGDVSLEALIEQHGPLPTTVESLTGGGGRHIFFRYPGYPVKSGAGALGPGLDIKGDGGYIVATPSLHASGRRYEWEASSRPDKVPIAEAPAWLLAKLRPEATNGHGKQFTVGERIREGERNATLFRLARSLKAKGLSEATILAAMQTENQAKCAPPLPDAEIERIAANAFGQADRPDFERNGNGNSEEQRQKGPERFSEQVECLLQEPDSPIEWAVADLWPADANGLMGGEPKTLKTWISEAFAWCLATGHPFADHFQIPRPRTVLFIEEEDPRRRTKDRLKGLSRGIGGDPGGRLHIAIKTGLKLDEPEGVRWLREEIARIGAEVVILDTLRRVHTKDENNQKEMAVVLSAMEKIRRETGAIVIAVHHFRKAGGIGTSRRGGQNLSGTTDLHAWVDSALYTYATRHPDEVKIIPESKDGAVEPFVLRLEGRTGGGIRLVYKEVENNGGDQQKEKIIEVIRELEAAGEEPTQQRIAAALGMSGAGVAGYLGQLAAEGRVVKDRIKSGRAWQNCWRLVHDANA